MTEHDRNQVLAFRLASHHLDRRLETGALSKTAAACGIQETPLGSAPVALHARVDGMTVDALEHAMVSERTLATLWSVRGVHRGRASDGHRGCAAVELDMTN